MPCPFSPVISFSTPDNLLQAPTTLASGACWAYVHALGSSPQPAVGLELVVKSSASSLLGWDSSEICSTAPPRGYRWDWAQLPISSDLMVMVSSLPFPSLLPGFTSQVQALTGVSQDQPLGKIHPKRCQLFNTYYVPNTVFGVFLCGLMGYEIG